MAKFSAPNAPHKVVACGFELCLRGLDAPPHQHCTAVSKAVKLATESNPALSFAREPIIVFAAAAPRRGVNSVQRVVAASCGGGVRGVECLERAPRQAVRTAQPAVDGGARSGTIECIDWRQGIGAEAYYVHSMSLQELLVLCRKGAMTRACHPSSHPQAASSGW